MGIHKECPWCYTKFNPWYHCPKCNHDFSYEYCDGYEAARDRFENKDIASVITEKLYSWMSKQKYGSEAILHAAVCCDFVGVTRFKKSMSKIIEEEIYNNQINQTQKDMPVI